MINYTAGKTRFLLLFLSFDTDMYQRPLLAGLLHLFQFFFFFTGEGGGKETPVQVELGNNSESESPDLSLLHPQRRPRSMCGTPAPQLPPKQDVPLSTRSSLPSRKCLLQRGCLCCYPVLAIRPLHVLVPFYPIFRLALKQVSPRAEGGVCSGRATAPKPILGSLLASPRMVRGWSPVRGSRGSSSTAEQHAHHTVTRAALAGRLSAAYWISSRSRGSALLGSV